MPRSKNLQHYPARYAEIIRETAVEGKVVELLLPDVHRANSLRGHWYAYIGALKAEAARRRLAARGQLVDDDICELEVQAPMTMIWVEAQPDGRVRVVWQNREKSWQALAVAGATVTGGDSWPTAAGLDETAMRLLKVQESVDKGDGDEHQ